jgi:hypothetical protein
MKDMRFPTPPYAGWDEEATAGTWRLRWGFEPGDDVQDESVGDTDAEPLSGELGCRGLAFDWFVSLNRFSGEAGREETGEGARGSKRSIERADVGEIPSIEMEGEKKMGDWLLEV